MSRQTSAIPTALGQKSHRDLSAPSIGTTDFGRLDVLYHTPVNPGEDINLRVKCQLQNAPLVVNTFGEMRYDIRVFFVPYRVLTRRPEDGKSNFVWDYFIQKLSNTQHPYTLLGYISNYAANSDLLGVNPMVMQDFKRLLSQLRFPSYVYNTIINSTSSQYSRRIDLWPFLAYQRIWWDFYRDSTFIDESLLSTYIPYPVPGDNGLSGDANRKNWFMPRYACFDKDYFTMARPNQYTDNTIIPAAKAVSADYAIDNIRHAYLEGNDGQGTSLLPSYFDSQDQLGIPATWIRSALALDNYLQRLNIVGTKIKDRMKARFGVKSSYQKVNTAMYLGGKSQKFTIGEMQSVSDSYVDDGQLNAFNVGNPDGQGMLLGQRGGRIDQGIETPNINFHSEEYGELMIIGTLIPKTGYYQGLDKKLQFAVGANTDEQRSNYLTPEFANLGLEPIRLGELYTDNNYLDQYDFNAVWGWTERYGSYGFQPAVVDGDMVLKETYQGMDAYHLFRELASSPIPGNSFNTINPNWRLQFDRIFQIQGQSDAAHFYDHFTRFTYVDCDMVRALPSSWLPELYEDNNHGNTTQIEVGGTRF